MGILSSIQDAIDATKSFPDVRITIYHRGRHLSGKGERYTPGTPDLTLKGAGAGADDLSAGMIYFDFHQPGAQQHFPYTRHLLVQGEDFRAEGLTVENTAGPVGQAVALSVEADRCVFVNCRFLGHQDTLYLAGGSGGAAVLSSDCYIDGTTDFIFGEATAYFENCTLHSKSEFLHHGGQHAARQRLWLRLFIQCRLTAEEGDRRGLPGATVAFAYARTAFVECYMDDHIRPEGWNNWSDPDQRTPRLFTQNTGTPGPGGVNRRARVNWCHQLSRRQARRKYRAERIFQGLSPIFP